MIWKLLFVSFGFASAQAKIYVDPEYLDELWASGKDEEFAQLLNLKMYQVRSNKSGEGSKLSNDYSFGDILLPEEQSINYLNFKDRRWPNGKIPYFISQKSYNAEQRQTIINAIKDLNSKTTNLKLVPYRGGKDYVFVFNGYWCFSTVGRAIGQQPLILSETGCLIRGTIQHEFMHAAGLSHEHNRSDRDEYIEILWKNIPKSSHKKYEKSKFNSSSLGPYEYCSLMHYSIKSPATNKPIFKILKKNIDSRCIGQRDGPTDMDLQKIKNLYS